jgi:hypothetical protein
MSGKYRKEHNCLNCGFGVEEHYCSRCGQPNLELKDNFWEFISHSIAHYFHFDNKFFQTLVPLLTKPGKVTLDYLAGKRARYINPISMYIFVSIVYFLLVPTPKQEKQSTAVKPRQTTHDLAVMDSVKRLIANDSTTSKMSHFISRKAFRKLNINDQNIVLKKLEIERQTNKSDTLVAKIERLKSINVEKNDSTYAAYLSRQKTLPADEKDNLLERYAAKRRISIGAKSAHIEEQLEHNRPKQYFLFMPLMALFVMLNFRKNHIRYLDHLIFTIHGMTAFFLVSIFTEPLSRLLFAKNSIMSSVIEIVLVTWVVWYLYKSLKVFYQRKTWTTIWRMLWIIILYSLTLEITEDIMRNIIYYLSA